ncbi:MAG: FAD-binding protein [Gammaproteobacteria bacterium]|jgi:electron transfer flavoprotein alpha subunit|nr:FAD-binding protein [Gammaproteobacteria bacterium]
MTSVLIIAELDGNQLNPSTAKCVTCAAELGADSIDVLILAEDCTAAAGAAAELAGVTRVRTVTAPHNATPLAAVFAPQVVALAADYGYVLAPSTTFGKDLLPRVAAILGVGQVSDIMSVLGPRTFTRPVYAGNAILTVEVPAGKTIVGTVRTASWRDAPTGGNAPVEPAEVTAELPTHTRYIGLAGQSSERPDLQSAKTVISGGRGVGSAENFELVFQLADKIGAGVGASRAAVDAGYVPNDMQVGQTGKIIAPELYVAIGISGAIQHLTGIKDAGTIVAINKDPEAPIFEIADYGLVGDLFEIVPELEQKLG